MKRLLTVLFAILALAGGEACAQDYIYTAKGQVIEATDVIFGPARISYHLYSDPTGPMLFIDTAEVEAIYYENGEKQVVHDRRAELRPGMSYADIKDLYDYKAYVPQPGDRYSPELMGFASISPGLGQCLEGEWGTGVLLFLGDAACWYTAFQTLKVRDDILEDGTAVHSVKPTLGTVFFAGCALAIQGFAIFDAVRIAKVKNMYYRVEPSLTATPAGNSAGLSLHVAF